MTVFIRSIAYHLPERVVTNYDLVQLYPHWNAETLFRKTGIQQRHLVADGETSLDLAEVAASKLLAETGVRSADVDALLFCTQTADYFLPASACVLHDRLRLSQHCAAFDINLGCSGFPYGLWLARSLVESGSAKVVLLLNADTLSRECQEGDQVTVPIFGDGAGATLICHSSESALAELGPTLTGTDGRGWRHLKIEGGGSRCPSLPRAIEMNGAEVFSFTLTAVEEAINQHLRSVGQTLEDVNCLLMHQANGFILETLRRRMNLPPTRCPIDIAETGNTASASLPVLFRRCLDRGELKRGDQVVLAGYGVGFSWGVTSLQMLREG